jgi:chemotaxis protein MotB
MILEDVQEQAVEEENYFVSMTDMMVGLIFIFIILLMYYALQFKDVTDQLTSADRTRADILQQLQESLKQKGVKVTIDTQNGVLHLPESILFDKGQAELQAQGGLAAGKLAEALDEVLPCYASEGGSPTACKTKAKHLLESVYIEGHTDVDDPHGVGCLKDNLALSACRAVATFRAVVNARTTLRALCTFKSSKCEKVLSVSGYGPERPVAIGADEDSMRRNRRIDLRLIMVTPDGGKAVGAVETRLATP